MAFVQRTIARADAWIDFWGRKRPDAIELAAGQILRISSVGLHSKMHHLGREIRGLMRRPAPGVSIH